MKQKIIITTVVAASLLLAGCGEVVQKAEDIGKVSTPEVVTPENKTVQASQEIKEQPKTEQTGLAPYFQTSDVEYKTLEPLKTDEVLAKYKTAMLQSRDKEMKTYDQNAQPTKWEDIAQYFHFYDAGTIKKAPYSGWKLVILNQDCDGPCMSASIYRFAYDKATGKLELLNNHSTTDNWGYSDMSVFDSDDDFTISGLTLPKSITLPNGVDSAELDGTDIDLAKPQTMHITENNLEVFDSPYTFADPGKVAFTDARLGDIYFAENNSGCLFVKLPDGTLSKYAYDPKMFDQNRYQYIKLNDSTTPADLTGEYSLMARGCGIQGSCYFIENVKEADLNKIGKTTNGIDLYMVKNPVQIAADVLEKTATDDYSKYSDAQKTFAQAYNTYSDTWQYMNEETRGKAKMTFEQFVAAHPILYWKDPFGRFVAIILNSVREPAECGKPVIYLYPEKTTDVSVKVGIKEFTKTVPEYGQGWTVQASPDGKLLNYADGQNYPYLFWEGKTDKSVDATTGFVVARGELKEFLNNSLDKLGLNETEKKDFTDFWLAKMEASRQPYFLISFLGTSEFNKIAPLTISPRPETLIRVFMYYQPVASKLEMKPQVLKALPRKGFTVVEWGGTSSDSWQVQ
jgi:hypothetical protein